MKVTILLDVPLEEAMREAKGDRSYRDIGEVAGLAQGNFAHLHKALSGRSGVSLEMLRAWGEVMNINVDEAIKSALREKGL